MMFGGADTEVGFHQMRVHKKARSSPAARRRPRAAHRAASLLSLGVILPEAHGDLLERSGTVVGFGGSIVDNTFAEVTDMCGLGSPCSHGVARSSISLDGPRTLMEGHVDTGIEHVLDLYLGHQVVWDLSIGVVNSA